MAIISENILGVYMKNFSFAIISNVISLLLISFTISFFIFNYFFNYKLAIMFSVIVSLISVVIYIAFATKKKIKEQNQRNKNKDIEQTFIELNFRKKSDIYSLFIKAFTKLDKLPKKINNGIYLKKDNAFIYFAFGFEGVSKTDVLKAYNLIKKGEKAIIYSSYCSEEIKNFAKRFNNAVQIESKQNIYSILESTDSLPKPCHFILQEDYRKRATLKGFFDRKKAKSFLTLGLTFSFMSLFVRYKIYYLITGTIFLLFFAFSLFFVIIAANIKQGDCYDTFRFTQ